MRELFECINEYPLISIFFNALGMYYCKYFKKRFLI